MAGVWRMTPRRVVSGGVAVAAVALALTVSSPAPTCQTVPPEINRTGRVEVTDELQAVFDQAAGCLRFPRHTSQNPARYLVDRIVVDGKSDLRIYGSGATLVRTGHNDHAPFFEVRHSTDVLVQNLRLRGVEKDCLDSVEVSPAEEFEAGIQVMWSERVTINYATVIRHSGDGAFVGWGVGTDGWAHGQIPPSGIPVVVPQSKNIRIANSSFDCVARQGMAVAWTDGILIERNKFDRVALTGIDFEHFGVRNATIRANSFGYVRDQLFISSVPLENLDYSANHSAEPIYIELRGPTTNALFADNVSDAVMGAYQHPNEGHMRVAPFLRVSDGDGVRLVGNVQKFAPGLGFATAHTIPARSSVPGTSLRLTVGACTLYAERNDFSQAKDLWNIPATFPSGCAWTDGGGNVP